MKTLKEIDYDKKLLDVIFDLQDWDDIGDAIEEAYKRALDDRNKDVKETVLEFGEYMNILQEKGKYNQYNINIRRKYKEIFGDWKI